MSATTSRAIDRDLEQCRDEVDRKERRIEALRTGLEEVAKADGLGLIDHLPGLLAGALCIAGVGFANERANVNEAATATLIGACSGLGLILDSLLTDTASTADPKP